MPLIVVVAGPYSAVYTPPPNSGFSANASGAGGSPQDQGILDDSGYELAWVSHSQRVNNTDRYGDTLLESVYRGADWSLKYLSKEFPQSPKSPTDGNVMNAIWPWGKVTGSTNSGFISPHLSVPGIRGSDIAGGIVLTSIAGTSASGNPATLTAASVQASDNMRRNLNFTVRIRELLVELLMYPYLTTLNSAPYKVWFVCT